MSPGDMRRHLYCGSKMIHYTIAANFPTSINFLEDLFMLT